MIIRPFDNMRRSQSNEVLDRWDQVKESLWIGHSATVMLKHYLVLKNKDFAGAAEADLGSQISHAESHAKPTGTDGKIG